MKGRLIIYFKKQDLKDRWFWGDRYLRSLVHFFRKKNISSLERVFINLCKALEAKKISFVKNLSFDKIKDEDKIVVLGIGKNVLRGYHKKNKIIAGIGLMTHPNEWPTLFEDYPIATYLQHSTWTARIYNKWYGENTCTIWPVGIDTYYWEAKKTSARKDILVYVKFLWSKERNTTEILKPILNILDNHQVNYKLIIYGSYTIKEYKKILKSSIGMIFLCEHESQGLAYQEAMAMDVPIFAWDQGFWLDTNRFTWEEKEPVPASSVPYFDETCGEKFKDLEEFNTKLPKFIESSIKGKYEPRDYILKNLSLEKSAERILAILNEVYG